AFLDGAYPPDGVVVYAGGGPMSVGGPRRLTTVDVETIVAATGVPAWDPLVFAGPRDVRHGGATRSVPVMGLSEQGAHVRRRGANDGDYLSAADVRSRAAVALLGVTTARQLFGDASPLGETIFVDGVAFVVRGVLEERGSDPHGGDQDHVVVVPYTTLLERLLRATQLSAVTFRLDDPGRVEATAREITALLRREHGIGAGQEDDFSVFTAATMQAMFRRSFRTFELFVPAIAGALFLVSALVILAVAQLGVRARRGEIGLRKAVGARAGDVETQIVCEVVVVAGAAALVGLALAPLGLRLLEPLLAAKFGIRDLPLTLPPMLLAATAAIATAAAGSVLPARRAARLDAVAALR
ncbi:MAG: ABC transporter permease, partial [Thermoanaerobaculia bacterium]|nr:ABC transporter permease [Thermoanaerobaculia bacterium]